MPIIETNKDKIVGLEARITELESDVQSRDEQISNLQTDLATANENLSAATADLTQAKADLADANSTIEANAERVKKSEEQEATFSDRVEAGALAKFQSLGGPPVEDAAGGTESAMPRAEFEKLPHAKRNEFIRGGGKVSK